MKTHQTKRPKWGDILIPSLSFIGITSLLAWYGYLNIGVLNNSNSVNWDTSFNGVLTNLRQYKGFTYVLLEKEKEYWRIDNSRNYDYNEAAIADFIREGDVLLKNKCSDTLFIVRKNQRFHFLIGDALYNSKKHSEKFISHWSKQRRIVVERKECN